MLRIANDPGMVMPVTVVIVVPIPSRVSTTQAEAKVIKASTKLPLTKRRAVVIRGFRMLYPSFLIRWR